MTSFFSSSRVSVSDNCKQSITGGLFFTINDFTDIVLKLGSAYQWENCLTVTNCACRRCGRSPSPTVWFTQNGRASVVDSTADFLSSAQLSPFVRVTGNNGFITKSLLTKRLHAQFHVVRQFLPRDAMHKRGLCRHAVSVCLSRSWSTSKRINVSSTFFHYRVATPF